jgi:hypothetical protein
MRVDSLDFLMDGWRVLHSEVDHSVHQIRGEQIVS